MSESTQEAIDKLAALTDIAGWLLAEGFKGKRYSSVMCPVALYLNNRVEGMSHIVAVENVYAHLHRCALPQPIVDFIDQFDRGDFPSLIVY
jgi:hypothetical protein